MSDKDPGIRARRGRAEVSGERKEEKYNNGAEAIECSSARMALRGDSIDGKRINYPGVYFICLT